ncbi:hypothetical protein ACFLZ5_06615 [Thermodesulfobacteriota bacterium]
MPILVRDVNGGLGVSILGWGEVTEKEYVDAFTKHLTQDSHKLIKYRYCIADWMTVTKVEIPTVAIKLIARLSKNAATVNPDVIIATVADQDIMYGLSRMAQTLRDDAEWENEVFRNRQEAEAWITARVKQKYGIENPTFD